MFTEEDFHVKNADGTVVRFRCLNSLDQLPDILESVFES